MLAAVVGGAVYAWKKQSAAAAERDLWAEATDTVR
ncbi:DLW-39 family protein [Kineococcus gynurae]|uniref:DLW-39 family protein n=1 Tax=Kineococcus gynurae TaxID=452979 RepID=A0ABV5LSW8_9ACTN